MPRHIPRVKSRMPPKRRQEAHQVRAHMPPRNRMKTNTGFRGNTHHTTRTHSNPGFRGNTHHTTRTHSNPGAQGRGNFHHRKRTNPNPGKRGVRPNQGRNPNPGFRGNTHHTTRTHSNPAHRQVQDKRKIIVQAVKSPRPPIRKIMSAVEILKQKLKANRVLMVRPRVQRTGRPVHMGVTRKKTRKRSALEILQDKLKSNQVLMVRPKVQRITTPAVTVHPVAATVHAHTHARTVSYQPPHRAHRNRTPHSSQQVPSGSAASAQSHKMDSSQADNENIAEITDKSLLFLKKHRAELINKVKNVVRIVDYLELSSENAAIVRAQVTDQERMRKLLEFTTSKRAAEHLIKVLVEQVGDVMEDLNEFSNAGDDAGDDVEDDGGDDDGDDAEDDGGDDDGDDAEDDGGDDAGDDAEDDAGDDVGDDAEDDGGDDAGDDAEDDAGDDVGDDAGVDD
ncbi:nucleoprotein TPR isoform X3 [Pangasianodon hypophthalmus]|uniref:nucleoprotein TPR isoform X3 n=1 Tax=Pangasianodon hypophthalmus TaxID=310915 RepID=UPI0023071A1A|nr:nucleoprotein TPR isoform X3 [Pangasianodon hypophthalmus]